jgi:hypothetical protein
LHGKCAFGPKTDYYIQGNIGGAGYAKPLMAQPHQRGFGFVTLDNCGRAGCKPAVLYTRRNNGIIFLCGSGGFAGRLALAGAGMPGLERMAPIDQIPDAPFVEALRLAVEQYLTAVDQWEAAYQKYYRLPTFGSAISDDLKSEQSAYDERRRELEAMLPRARRLCLKHRLPEAFSGLLRISLGQYAPQERIDSVIGRSERGAVTMCLVQLEEACREWTPLSVDRAAQSGRTDVPLLRRLVNFFY